MNLPITFEENFYVSIRWLLIILAGFIYYICWEYLLVIGSVEYLHFTTFGAFAHFLGASVLLEDYSTVLRLFTYNDTSWWIDDFSRYYRTIFGTKRRPIINPPSSPTIRTL